MCTSSLPRLPPRSHCRRSYRRQRTTTTLSSSASRSFSTLALGVVLGLAWCAAPAQAQTEWSRNPEQYDDNQTYPAGSVDQRPTCTPGDLVRINRAFDFYLCRQMETEAGAYGKLAPSTNGSFQAYGQLCRACEGAWRLHVEATKPCIRYPHEATIFLKNEKLWETLCPCYTEGPSGSSLCVVNAAALHAAAALPLLALALATLVLAS